MSKKKQSEEELLQTLGDFTSKENWDKFFTIRGSDDSFEWYAEWPQLKDPLLSHLSSTAPPSDPASEPPQPPPPPLQILVPGCGNSRLSEHLYDAGFHGITNVDFSKVVISDMLRRNVRSRPDMRWRVMDITSMQDKQVNGADEWQMKWFIKRFSPQPSKSEQGFLLGVIASYLAVIPLSIPWQRGDAMIGETVDHFFLHCPLALGLWYRLFRLANLDWVPLRNIYDMMTISYKVLGSSIRGKVLWQTTCLAIIWVVWRERCVKIFQDKFPDGSFDAILDKGGLDALMEPELGPKLGKMYLTEVKRVLKSGGKFIGLTLAESHVLGLLFSKFRFGWKMSIHVVSQKPSNKPSLLTFMVVAEKESSTVLHQITTSFARSSLDLNGNQARGLYEAIENENRIRREYSNGSDLIYSLEDLQLGAKGDLLELSQGRRFQLTLGEYEGSRFSYRAVVLDARQMTEPFLYHCGVFLVPKASLCSSIFV
ncbi:Methyltransferase-like protein 13 [Vitis vinifera]|uniref:Methyltransferase-like protein 13 n=1 Tax=Vitis vinifera TaxID=29760 RepID=A0A438HEW7_VITVI|nr:Methyltransferase-like protein 13 [Vitis vinifera]